MTSVRILGIDPGSVRTGVGIVDAGPTGASAHVFHAALEVGGEGAFPQRLRRIFEALGALFPAPWVNTGHSKGGMTALFHRRYFPCDVAATAALRRELEAAR